MPKKMIVRILALSLIFLGYNTAAVAAVVSTQEAVSMASHEARLASVQATLARSDVRAAMVRLGVDPQQAELRVSALSETELAALHGHLDTEPAGGILALIGAVFVVLLILELTGATDIFKKV